MGLMLCLSYIIHYTVAKKVDALQKDVDDMIAMMRVLRYHALKDSEEGDKL